MANAHQHMITLAKLAILTGEFIQALLVSKMDCLRSNN